MPRLPNARVAQPDRIDECPGISPLTAALLIIMLALASVSCSADDPVKAYVGLGQGPVTVTMDSAGQVNLSALDRFRWKVASLNQGVTEAQNQIATNEHAKNWYVIIQHGDQDVVFEFQPDGYMQVKLNGNVVQEIRMRVSVVTLSPNATAEIAEISAHTTSGSTQMPIPEPMIPNGFVGNWTGHISYLESPNPIGKGYTRPPRPITVHIPSETMPPHAVEGRPRRLTGSAELPRADFKVKTGSGVNVEERPAKRLLYTLSLSSNTPRAISVSRVYFELTNRDAEDWFNAAIASFSLLPNGKLYMEQYFAPGSGKGGIDFVGLLTRE